MLGVDGADAQYSYRCYGNTYFPHPPLELVVQGEARLAHIGSGVWDVGPTFTPIENTAEAT